MDAYTLAISNLLFLVLYAVTTMVYRPMYRGMGSAVRGCDWFIASNLVLAVPSLQQVAPAFFPYHNRTFSVILLSLLGHLLMHRAFAALRGEEGELWWAQVGITSAGLALWLSVVLVPYSTHHLSLIGLIYGAQYGLIGLMMFRPSESIGRTAGWFTGGTGVAYAIFHMVWYGMSRFLPGMGWSGTEHVWSSVRLATQGALALGFLLMSVSRLHIQMRRETELDELTGLMNLRAIRRVAAAAIARCHRRKRAISVVMIDLDNFKNANDRLGHEAGDVLLCSVADALMGSLREKDKVARLGGDEFCLLLPCADKTEAMRIAERCRVTLQEMFVPYEGEGLQVTASFGVAHSDDSMTDWEELLRNGDAAMYEAKRAGGNRVAVAGKGVLSLLTMPKKNERLGVQIEATEINIRSSASATSFWTKGSAKRTPASRP
jgi:diguanylate cyclase (GGDEF)-like protein